ncbi:hypothetical protein DFH08DRAFT_961843 [Mycena albidolilacea]|uniref:Uncharacterized protein n=1 Tax=Mycena albidolilacea TaxID=1033008 RepID=A0AAD6ZZ75_9AGAR|nr:hypothetical protein DFH08DRAFT_961843 [Mycena albidolilacea]
MLPFLLRTKVFALSLLLCSSSIYVASGESCGCSSLVIPVHVDVLIPKDPADPFGGLKSNASNLRRLDETYGVFGVFCQPNIVSPKSADAIQLLVHGFSYSNQYWSPPTEEFRNHSYTGFACNRGLSSLAIDLVGVGLSTRPVNASDVQYATNAAAVSQLAVTSRLLEGAQSPFDGFILTGELIVEPGAPIPGPATTARDDTPLRWGDLDPDYVTTSNRSMFYPLDPTSFSPRMLTFDNFTKDVGSLATGLQVGATSLRTHYTGPVAKVVGSEDQLFCAGTGRCADVAVLTAAERFLWREARSFDVFVAQGSGHDLNLDFFAEGPFNTFVDLVEQFTGV